MSVRRVSKGTFPGPLDAWWNWRRRRAWVLFGIIAYSATGFLAVPWLLERQLTAHSESWVGFPARVDSVRFNPWRLRLAVEGFALEADGERVIGADSIVVNVQLSSLFRLAVTFREVAVEAPFARLIRHSDGGLNIDPLLDALAGDPDAPAAAADEDDGPVRLLIQELIVAGGVIDVADEAHDTPFSASIGPIDVTIHDLTTLPERAGEQTVSVRTRQGTELLVSGALELDPFVANGHVVGRGPYLPLLYQYFQDQIDFELSEGDVELEFDYAVSMAGDGLEASLRNLDGVLRGMALRPEGVVDPDLRIARLPEIRVSAGELHWPGRRVSIGSFQVIEPQISIRRDASGSINVLEMVPAPTGDPDAGAGGPPWSVGVTEFGVVQARVELTDEVATVAGEPAGLEIAALDVDVADFSTEPDSRFRAGVAATLGGGGRLSFAGPVGLDPQLAFAAEVQIDDLALPVIQPWLQQVARVTLRTGALDVDGTLELANGQFSFSGNGAVQNLSIYDELREEPMVGWQHLGVDQVVFSALERSLDISAVTLDAPYAQLHIARDGSTNVAAVLDAPSPSEPVDQAAEDEVTPDSAVLEPAGGPSEAAPLGITVGAVTVSAGSADFSDLSLPLPFGTRIDELAGTLSAMSSVSELPASLELTGTVGEFGLLEVGGQVAALQPAAATDLNVRFKNVNVPTLSPYVIKFAGREIDEGRMDLKLRYQVSGGQLQGDNNIVIRELKLGDRVDHPGAQDLPLDLAVALLTDSNGVIDLDLPVSGDLGDPEFSIGGIVAGAFGNLIGGIVTSPFRLLGSLVGAGGGDIDSVEFRPGTAALTPPALEKLDQLSSALAQRPALQLQVTGVWNSELDLPALQRARLQGEVDARLRETDESAPLLERRRRVLEKLARERLDADLGARREAHQVPGALGGAQLDVPAYLAGLEESLSDAEMVSASDLTALAQARASAVEAAVSATGELTGRVELAGTAQGKADEDGWITMRLALEH